MAASRPWRTVIAGGEPGRFVREPVRVVRPKKAPPAKPWRTLVDDGAERVGRFTRAQIEAAIDAVMRENERKAYGTAG